MWKIIVTIIDSPFLTTQAANLFQSVVAFVGDGCGTVDDAGPAALGDLPHVQALT